MKKLPALFLTMFCLFLFSCSSDDNPDEPGISKNLQYPVSLTIDKSTKGQDNWLIYADVCKDITQPRETTDKLGYKGIIMYSDRDRQLHAFDLACPNCWNGNLLKEFHTGLYAGRYECAVCGFSASLDNGFGTDPKNKDKAIYLVTYNVTKIGDNLYSVTNPK